MAKGKKKTTAKKSGKAKRGAAKKTKATKAKVANPKADKRPKRTSALDAAAQVLKASGKPMRAKDLIDAMAAKGLWKSPGGATPYATLYAAMLREIAAQGKDARFRKVERGLFEYAG